MKTRNKIMIAAFVVLAVAAAVLVFVGVMTHKEPGLLGACFGPDGRVEVYESTGASGCPEVRWDASRVPLRVHASTSNPYPPAEPGEATRGAIDFINARLGFDLFRYVEEGVADVEVRVGEAVEVGAGATLDGLARAGGDASHRLVGGLLSAEVRTANTGTVGVLHRVLVHELLHAAGLAHDPFEDSVMFPRTRGGPDEVGRLDRLWITDSDRATLRELYAPR